MIRRKTYKLREGTVIEIEEYPEVNHRGQGITRKKKEKPSTESQIRKNRIKRQKKVRHTLIQYFDMADYFVTLTYRPEMRPTGMGAAKKDFRMFRQQMARYFKKKKKTLCWMRNIEKGTKGAWHIHLIIKNVDGLLDEIERVWKFGRINACRIGKDERFAELHFRKLAAYITKDETPFEKRQDGTYQKPRISEASFSMSRNMPLPEPKVERLERWKKDPYCKKGYRILEDSKYEGIDVMGFLFRKYTMVRLI